MYTKEDFFRDYPPKKEYPFVLPWEKEYHEKAIREAIQKSKLETAGNMLAKGFEIPFISEITGLSEDDILALQKGIKKSKLEITRKMLAKGLEIPFISEITGLSEDDILTLKAE
jgi:predicted transposase YdaD